MNNLPVILLVTFPDYKLICYHRPSLLHHNMGTDLAGAQGVTTLSPCHVTRPHQASEASPIVS